MKYLSFVRSSEKYRNAAPPAALMTAMGALVEKYTKMGALLDTGGLANSSTGFKIRCENREIRLVDGPFSEAKEVIGGWAMLEAKSKEEIVKFTMEFVELHRQHWPEFDFECEVRPIEFLASDMHR